MFWKRINKMKRSMEAHMMKFLKRKLPALALALVMLAGMIPAASAASADISYSVKAGKTITFDYSDFDKYFDSESSTKESFYRMEFTGASGLDSAGKLYALDDYGDTVSLTESNIKRYWFYYDSDDIEDDIDLRLRGMYFVANSGSKNRTVTLDYSLRGDGKGDGELVTGKLEINVTTTSSSSSSSSGDVVYKVDANDEVTFDADDFNDVFQDEYSNYTMRYLEFDAPSSSDYADITLYYRYGKSSEYEFSRTEVDDYRFYYDDSRYGDYSLDNLSIVTTKNFDDEVELDFTAYYSDSRYVEGTLVITPSGRSNQDTEDADGDIEYEVDPGDEVFFDEDDFEDYYSDNRNGDFAYVEFTRVTNLSSANGTVYYDYDLKSEKSFSSSTLKNYKFYYFGCSSYGDYALDDLSFVAKKDFDGTIVLEFRAYSTGSKYVDGTLVIRSTDAGTKSSGTITYEVASNANISLNEADFYKFNNQYGSGSLKYIVFTDTDKLNNPNGLFYVGQDSLNGSLLSWNSLHNYKFYYSTENVGNDGYALNQLHFAAGRVFNSNLSLTFRAYSTASRYVTGTLTFKPGTGGATPTISVGGGDILYSTTYNSNLPLNANDFARFLKKTYPSSTLQYVKLGGVPSVGTLYYNYYNTSAYGARQTALTASAISSLSFYFSPSSSSQYSLGELTFLPNSRANYCETIPFTAYDTAGQSASGSILISVSLASVADVYGAVPKGTQVYFPSANIYNVVSQGTGVALGSIRLLKLPSSTAGTVYSGSGFALANTVAQYSYGSATAQGISQLRFVPAAGFTGSVEIPYMAYNTSGSPMATGKFCLGVVNAVKKFSDVPSTSWCYKYVTELSDAKVIDGYSDNTFKPDNGVTYGAALKLVMLAAGYPAQAPTTSNVFSGYLAKAKADGLVSGNVTLSKPITRLQMAQLAAKALKLSTTNLSSVKPFTDSTDPYLQALNAAGIVEGYYSNGTSTYRPNNTLTRGQMSAIVWRMQQYRNQ